MGLAPLHLIQRAVEQGKKNTLAIIGSALIVYLLKFAFTTYKETKVLEYFFIFKPDQAMTRPAYVDYTADCWTYIIIYFTMCYVLPKQREYLFIILLLWVGYYVEFYFMYNWPLSLFHLTEHIYLPIGYSTFALTSLIGMFVYRYLKK